MWRWSTWPRPVTPGWVTRVAGCLFASAGDSQHEAPSGAPEPAEPADAIAPTDAIAPGGAAEPTPDAPAPRPLRPHKELMTAWLLLLLDGGATYGYDLRRELDAHQLSIDPSILYRTLRKLERDGWVESRWMRSVAGPRRRFYRLTPTGRRTLDEMAELITSIRDFHDTFLHAHQEAVARREAPPAEETPATAPG